MTIRLKHVLLGAGAALLLAASVPFSAFAGTVSGKLEAGTGTQISGWAMNPDDPSASVTVELAITSDASEEALAYIQLSADQPRESDRKNPESSGHGFSYDINWSNYAGSSFTVTASILSGDQKIPLEGTVSYTKTDDAGTVEVVSASADVSSSDEEPEEEAGDFLGTFTASGYCSCSRCSGGHALTYSGTVPQARHTIAADTSIFPLGTRIMIDGIIYTVEDVGSGIHSDRLDIYFDSHQEALNYGLQKVDVYAVR